MANEDSVAIDVVPERTVDEHETSAESATGDIVIALVGAIGTHLDEVRSVLQEQLPHFDCEYDLVKMSDFIRQFDRFKHLDKAKMAARDYYTSAIDGGNWIREELGDASALSQLAVRHIVERRRKPSSRFRRAFVIDQLKRSEEVRLLREVYGPLFYCVSVYADEKTREASLTKLFRDPGVHERLKKLDARESARRLMDRDNKEKGAVWGQNVRGTFIEADYFVRSDEKNDVEAAVERFLNLVFDKPHISPTKSEVAMMQASTAAMRSADLSRQVGAVIAARDGRILTTGCNEVPRCGGGQYWEDDPDDKRDFAIGYDSNDRIKREALQEIIRNISGTVLPEMLLDGLEEFYEKLAAAHYFDDARIDALIEFGRVVHAEQAAIAGACVDTISIRGADLYCTTFPCHMCARLIIICGIRNVFYIEPYPKSAALELYSDSIEVDPKLSRSKYAERLNEDDICDPKVYFIPFEGVAPRRYHDLFEHGKRKNNDGIADSFDVRTAKPRRSPQFPALLLAEKMVADSVNGKLAALHPEYFEASSSDEAVDQPVEKLWAKPSSGE